MASDDKEVLNSSDAEDSATLDRREAMAKIGKYAAYTAPALLVLLSAKTSEADCNFNGNKYTCVDTGKGTTICCDPHNPPTCTACPAPPL